MKGNVRALVTVGLLTLLTVISIACGEDKEECGMDGQPACEQVDAGLDGGVEAEEEAEDAEAES